MAAIALAPGVARADTAPAAPLSLSDVVSRVSSSVVAISVVKRAPSETQGDPPRLIVSSGSGVVIQAGSYILSNAHVLDHALVASITTSTGTRYTINPKEIWADPVSDLAVAKVRADLPPATWGKSADLRLGDAVFAMGAPYGLRFRGSISRGVISGFERELDADYTFIQTDAPINPGNSGGPLFNERGEVVGINARGIRGADGMGFSIPADIAREIADQLIQKGKVERAWLGLGFVDAEEANLGWSSSDGPMITNIEPDGPAAKAGLQTGDTLLKLNGTLVASLEEIGKFLRSVTPGTPVSLTYRRGEQEFKASITASVRPHDAELYVPVDGLWTELTPAQQERALQFGKDLAFLQLEDLQDSWVTYEGGAKALLVTEYLALAQLSYASVREDRTLAAAQAEAEARRRKGLLEVVVDVPITFSPIASQLRAEWHDAHGIIRADSVSLADGAPPGFRRIVVKLKTTMLEKTGQAALLLQIDSTTSRRFVFQLTRIH